VCTHTHAHIYVYMYIYAYIYIERERKSERRSGEVRVHPNPKLHPLLSLRGHNLRFFAAQVMLLLRAIFQDCRLVHADFSEYNLLWYDGRVVVIDVSQVRPSVLNHIN